MLIFNIEASFQRGRSQITLFYFQTFLFYYFRIMKNYELKRKNLLENTDCKILLLMNSKLFLL